MNDESGLAARATALRQRTKVFALAIVKLYCALPKSTEAQVLGRQVLRSGTSVGAHYAEATRARSDAEFVAKIEGGLQELQETLYWLELLQDAEILQSQEAQILMREADELIRIFVASTKTTKARIAREAASKRGANSSFE